MLKLEKTKKRASFGSPAILFKLINSHAWSTQITVRWNLILLVKTPIIFKSLNGVYKQNTFRNVKRDKRCRLNTTIVEPHNIMARLPYYANVENLKGPSFSSEVFVAVSLLFLESLNYILAPCRWNFSPISLNPDLRQLNITTFFVPLRQWRQFTWRILLTFAMYVAKGFKNPRKRLLQSFSVWNGKWFLGRNIWNFCGKGSLLLA